MGTYRNPDWLYVSKFLEDHRFKMEGLHRKIDEVERLRYYEDDIQLPPDQVKVGLKVRIGLSADLIEQVKAAILANSPRVHVEPLRKHQDAGPNSSKRERHLQAHIDSLNQQIAEFVDSTLMGVGFFKAAESYLRWGKVDNKKRSESTTDYKDKVNAYKKLWGVPVANNVIHPLAIYFRLGMGSRIDELVEHSWKPRELVYEQYGWTDGQLQFKDAQAAPGIPDQYIKSLPYGVNTTNYVLTTEYWNPECYQVYVNSTLVYDSKTDGDTCGVSYFIATGRTSSSKDPDKYAISIVENQRHNEPVINRLLTRMTEAVDLTVNKRLTLEVPESYIPEVENGTDGTTRPRTWTFRDDATDALPAGSKIVDAYDGASEVFAAMPLVQLLIQLANQHGVSPLFKGVSPGAAGSGYRDNSLYLMAKSMFEYIIKSVEEALSDYIVWYEWLLVNKIKQQIWIEDYDLSPSDIEQWPARLSIELKPTLPQNLIAEGEFWERQRQAGNVSRRRVREFGLGIEQPDEEEEQVEIEQLQEALRPILMQDVLKSVLGQRADPNAQPSGLVGPDGQPISSNGATDSAASNSNVPTPPTGTSLVGRGVGRDTGRQLGGFATGGVSRQPPSQPAQFPPGNGANR